MLVPQSTQTPSATPNLEAGDARATRMLAKTIYKELRASGLDERDVMSLASTLLGLVADDLRSSRD